MRQIKEILWVEKLKKGDKPYERTHALLDDGSIAVGYGSDFKVDDLVEHFHHAKWDVNKISLPKHKRRNIKDADRDI